MKNFFKQHYHYHLIIGLILGRLLCFTFEGVALPFQFVLSALAVGMVAFFWEAYWSIKNYSVPDFYDVFWSCIGGVLGVIVFQLNY